jgi:hypothetical protein
MNHRSSTLERRRATATKFASFLFLSRSLFSDERKQRKRERKRKSGREPVISPRGGALRSQTASGELVASEAPNVGKDYAAT